MCVTESVRPSQARPTGWEVDARNRVALPGIPLALIAGSPAGTEGPTLLKAPPMIQERPITTVLAYESPWLRPLAHT